MDKPLFPGIALLVASVLLHAPAHANPILIGLQEAGVNHGFITIEATSRSGTAAIAGRSYGTFSGIAVRATGSPGLPQPQLVSHAISTSSASYGSLEIYVTELNITSPLGIHTFLSSFTEDLFNGRIKSVKETTYLSPANTPFGSSWLLASHTFTGLGTASSLNGTLNLRGPYSETEAYMITATGRGTMHASIDPDSVPEPASLLLLATGLLGLGLIRRRRRCS